MTSFKLKKRQLPVGQRFRLSRTKLWPWTNLLFCHIDWIAELSLVGSIDVCVVQLKDKLVLLLLSRHAICKLVILSLKMTDRKLIFSLLEQENFLTHSIAVPIFSQVSAIAYTKLKVSWMGRQRQLEGECIVNDVSSARSDDLWESAECVSLRLPTVPAWSDKNFFVETQIFHFHCANDSWLRFLDNYIFKWNIAGFQFASESVKRKYFWQTNRKEKISTRYLNSR